MGKTDWPDWPPRVPGADGLSPPGPFAGFRRPQTGAGRGSTGAARTRRGSHPPRLPASHLARILLVAGMHPGDLVAITALAVLLPVVRRNSR